MPPLLSIRFPDASTVSRDALGKGWLEVYLEAPIWRFWLGPEICGRTVIGALMPSVDGVGRYFPLSLVWSDPGFLAPPEVDARDAWFAAAEAVLLGALAEGVRYDDLLARLAALPAPEPGAAGAGEAAGEQEGADVPALFRALRRERLAELYGPLSCWWVPSHDGGATPPKALMFHGLPVPSAYAAMLGPARPAAVRVAVGDA